MAKHHGLRSWLCQLFGCGKKRIVFGWTIGKPQLKKNTKMLTLEVTNEQKIKVHLNPVTEAGKPTTLDGAPVWSVVSGPGKVEVAADGLSADLISDDLALGDTIYGVAADADLGDGVEQVADTITLRVSHANAKNLGLVADAPVLK